MVKFFKATCAICIASVCVCGIVAIGAVTANLVNDVIRKCKQPLVPERIEVPRTCLIKRHKPQPNKESCAESPKNALLEHNEVETA
jgi:hypothetical protein